MKTVRHFAYHRGTSYSPHIFPPFLTKTLFLLLLLAAPLAAWSNPSGPQDTLTISVLPQRNYLAGADAFSSSGMILTHTTGGSAVPVTSGWTLYWNGGAIAEGETAGITAAAGTGKTVTVIWDGLTAAYTVDVFSSFKELFYGTWKRDDGYYIVISETECVFYKADDALRSTVSIIHWTWKTNDGSGAAEYPEGFSITGAITFDTTASNIGFRQLFTPYLKTDRSAFNSGDVWIKQ